MKKSVANLPASVRQRLLNLATERKQDFGLVLTHYALERLLYRLRVSPATHLLLAGTELFYSAESFGGN